MVKEITLERLKVQWWTGGVKKGEAAVYGMVCMFQCCNTYNNNHFYIPVGPAGFPCYRGAIGFNGTVVTAGQKLLSTH